MLLCRGVRGLDIVSNQCDFLSPRTAIGVLKASKTVFLFSTYALHLYILLYHPFDPMPTLFKSMFGLHLSPQVIGRYPSCHPLKHLPEALQLSYSILFVLWPCIFKVYSKWGPWNEIILCPGLPTFSAPSPGLNLLPPQFNSQRTVFANWNKSVGFLGP